MINFAFCYEKEDELNFIKNEVQKCFKVREIEVSIKTYSHAADFGKCLKNNCPDVIFYNLEGERGMFHELALAAKKINPKLIPIVTRDKNCDERHRELLLEPVYILPSMSRRHIWVYAIMAYEISSNNIESFSYYARPDYNKVPIDDIMYFASEGRRTHMIAHGYRDTFYQKLDEIEIILKPKNAEFIRIHKSYLVNMLFISGYTREFVILKNGEKLRISRYNYYKLLEEKCIMF